MQTILFDLGLGKLMGYRFMHTQTTKRVTISLTLEQMKKKKKKHILDTVLNFIVLICTG